MKFFIFLQILIAVMCCRSYAEDLAPDSTIGVQGQQHATPTDSSAKKEVGDTGIDACVRRISNGLSSLQKRRKIYLDNKSFFETERLKISRKKSEIPSRIQKIMFPGLDPFQDEDIALKFIEKFSADLANADGETYRSRAMLTCQEADKERRPQANTSLQSLILDTVSKDSFDQIYTVLKVNSKWALLRPPTAERFNKAKSTVYDENVLTPEQEKAFQKINKFNLSKDEYLSLRNYVSVGFRNINTVLRGSDLKAIEAQQPYVDMINVGLGKMPNFIGTVKRGGTLPDAVLAQHKVGAVVEYPGFTSTSTSDDGYMRSNHEFVIKSLTGKLIVDYSREDEREVLFRPGAKFKITDISSGYPKTFSLEEVAE